MVREVTRTVFYISDVFFFCKPYSIVVLMLSY